MAIRYLYLARHCHADPFGQRLITAFATRPIPPSPRGYP